MAGRRGIVKFDVHEMSDGTKYQIKVEKSSGTFFGPDPADPDREMGLKNKDLEALKAELKKRHREKTEARYKLFIEIEGYGEQMHSRRKSFDLERLRFKAVWVYNTEETGASLQGQANFLAPGKDPERTFAWNSEPSGPDDQVKRTGSQHRYTRGDLVPYTWERWQSLTQIKQALEEVRRRLEELFGHENFAQLLHEGNLPLMLAGKVETPPDDQG